MISVERIGWTMLKPLDVNEIFGPTFQGEGPSAGQACMFVRLANCNLECKWCDTYYTWAFTEEKAAKHNLNRKVDKDKEIHPMQSEDVMAKLEELHDIYEYPITVVISGGEPLMQSKALEQLARDLHGIDCPVHIETAGTLMPTPVLNRHVSQYVVSPKLEHSGNRASKRYKPGVLKWFAAHDYTWFKFVMQCKEDFDEVDQIVHDIGIPYNRVMIMPEGTTPKRLVETAKDIVQGALNRGYGLSLRQHVALWGDERGF